MLMLVCVCVMHGGRAIVGMWFFLVQLREIRKLEHWIDIQSLQTYKGTKHLALLIFIAVVVTQPGDGKKEKEREREKVGVND